eukprot:TRINITY_DN91806_c0_g1_i1.p1 TRINITY_DN91806_c0_g1~~TRINITY_DN91806_c0_g1_i1.p1  ORF type:complete len:578 (+),score=113.38 TRINITY_DN91806_c0_g1_i1:236-1735(+)
MVAVMQLLVETGLKNKRMRGRAKEHLVMVLKSRPWLKAAHAEPEIMERLKEFMIDNPDVKVDAEVQKLLEEPPVDSGKKRAAGAVVVPATKLDDAEFGQTIRIPLEEGVSMMRARGWQCDRPDDAISEGFEKFYRAVLKLSRTPEGKLAADGGEPSTVLEGFKLDCENILRFLDAWHEVKRMRRNQTLATVGYLRKMSPSFAAAEVRLAENPGLGWQLPDECLPIRSAASPPPPSAEAAKEGAPPAPAAASVASAAAGLPRVEEEGAPPAPAAASVASAAAGVPRVEEGALDAPPPPPSGLAVTVKEPPGRPPGEAGAGYPAADTLPGDRPMGLLGRLQGLFGDKGDKEKPTAAQEAEAAKPVIVWIDGNRSAYEKSSLNDEAGIVFQGFLATDASKPWLNYIFERADKPNRVSVAIMNKRGKDDAQQIRQYCESRGVMPPRFIVCGRAPEDEVRAEWGMEDLPVVKDWGEAGKMALDEARVASSARGVASHAAAGVGM